MVASVSVGFVLLPEDAVMRIAVSPGYCVPRAFSPRIASSGVAFSPRIDQGCPPGSMKPPPGVTVNGCWGAAPQARKDAAATPHSVPRLAIVVPVLRYIAASIRPPGQ